MFVIIYRPTSSYLLHTDSYGCYTNSLSILFQNMLLKLQYLPISIRISVGALDFTAEEVYP